MGAVREVEHRQGAPGVEQHPLARQAQATEQQQQRADRQEIGQGGGDLLRLDAVGRETIGEGEDGLGGGRVGGVLRASG